MPAAFQEPHSYPSARAASGDGGRAETASSRDGGRAGTETGAPSGPTHSRHRPSDLPLLQRPEVAETYVRLLCRFAPRGVLPFLSSGTVTSISPPSSSPVTTTTTTTAGALGGGAGGVPSGAAAAGMPEGYDVRRCIVFCREAGVVDAEAFLHERLGELEEAGRLYLTEVHRYGAGGGCTSLKYKGTGWEVVCM